MPWIEEFNARPGTGEKVCRVLAECASSTGALHWTTTLGGRATTLVWSEERKGRWGLDTVGPLLVVPGCLKTHRAGEEEVLKLEEHTFLD